MTKSVKRLVLAALGVLFLFAASLLAAACAKTGKVKLTFRDGDEVLATIEAEAGEDISAKLPSDPGKEGHIFEGWSLTEDGEAAELPAVMPEESATYYALWREARSATLTLSWGVDEGAREETKQVYEGTPLASLLAAVDPAVSGLDFAGWYRGNGVPVEDGAVMPATALKLTAKYYATYTARIFEQDTEGNYPAAATRTQTGSAFYGEAFSYAAAAGIPQGFRTENREGSRESTEKLGKDETFTVYLARESVAVIYRVNNADAPAGAETIYSLEVLYGTELTLLSKDVFGLGEEFFLYGWNEEGGTFHEAGAKLTVTQTETLMLDAQWARANRDVFHGGDFVFVAGEKAYLRRGGFEAEGVYDPATGVFAFRNGSDREMLGGVVSGGYFYYYNDTTDKTYSAWNGSAATLTFGFHGEAVYRPNGSGTELAGNLTVDVSTGRYFFRAEGQDPIEFVLDTTDGVTTFRTENKEETGYYAALPDRADAYTLDYAVLYFDGFGFVTEYYDPNAEDAEGRENYESYNGSVGRYFRQTAWGEDFLYYTLEFADGSSGTVSIETPDWFGGDTDLGGYPLKGVWYGYDGMLNFATYADNHVAGFAPDLSSDCNFFFDGFGHARLGEVADAENADFDDFEWTGSYIIVSDEFYVIDGSYGYLEVYVAGNDWIVYTDDATGETTRYSLDTSYRLYSEMKGEPFFRYLSSVPFGLQSAYFEDDFRGAALYDYYGDASYVMLLGYFYLNYGGYTILAFEPVSVGTVRETAAGVYTYTDADGGYYQDFDFILTQGYDPLGNAAQLAEPMEAANEDEIDFINDSETGERLWMDVYGRFYYRETTDAEAVTITAQIDVCLSADEEMTEQYFVRFYFPDGTVRIMEYGYDENDLFHVIREIEDPVYVDYEPADRNRDYGMNLRFYVNEEGTYFFGFALDSSMAENEGYAFYEGTVSAVGGSENEFDFVVGEAFAETLEYFGVPTSFRFRREGNAFAVYDEAISIECASGTLVTDGYGNATLTLPGGEAKTYTYGVMFERFPEGEAAHGELVLSLTETMPAEDEMVYAFETYLIVNAARDSFRVGGQEAGVYYAVDSDLSLIGQILFVLDGSGENDAGRAIIRIADTGGVSDVEGTYRAVGAVEDHLLLDYFGFPFTVYEVTVEDSVFYIAAALTTGGYAIEFNGEVLLPPMGIYFLQHPAYAEDIETEEGGTLHSDGFITYDELLISDAKYTIGGRTYRGNLMRGTYDDDTTSVSERYANFVMDAETGAGDVLLFEVYDERGNLVEEIFFDIVEDGDGRYATRRTMPSGRYAEMVNGAVSENYLRLDGYGNATYHSEGYDEVGTVAATGENDVFTFVGEDGTEFTFLLTVYEEETYVFFRDTKEARYVADDWSVLTLDGFNYGVYFDHYGMRVEGEYAFLGTQMRIVRLTDSATGRRLYFTLNGSSFTFNTEMYIVEDGYLLAFQGDSYVRDLVMPDDVRYLTEGSFPEGMGFGGTFDFKNVEVIGNNTFRNTDFYVNVVYGEHIRVIGDYAFYAEYNTGRYTKAITTITLPAITEIGENAFRNGSALEFVKLGAGLSRIGDYAFTMQYNRSPGGIVLDLTALTADQLAAADIAQYAFLGTDRGVPLIFTNGEFACVEFIIRLKNIETLLAFREDDTWPQQLRDAAVVGAADADTLSGVSFYSFATGAFLRFYNGQLTIGEGIGEPLREVGLYFIEEGTVKLYTPELTPFGETFAADAAHFTYEGSEFYRCSIDGEAYRHTVTLEGDNTFEFGIRFMMVIDSFYESVEIGYARFNGIDVSGGELVRVGDGTFVYQFNLIGTDADGAYTVTVNFADGELTGTHEYVRQIVLMTRDEDEAQGPDQSNIRRNEFRVTFSIEGDDYRLASIEQFNYTDTMYDRHIILEDTVTREGNKWTLLTHTLGVAQSPNVYKITVTLVDEDGNMYVKVDYAGQNQNVTTVKAETEHNEMLFESYFEATVIIYAVQLGDETYYVFYINGQNAGVARHDYIPEMGEYSDTAMNGVSFEQSGNITEGFVLTIYATGGYEFKMTLTYDGQGFSATLTVIAQPS